MSKLPKSSLMLIKKKTIKFLKSAENDVKTAKSDATTSYNKQTKKMMLYRPENDVITTKNYAIRSCQKKSKFSADRGFSGSAENFIFHHNSGNPRNSEPAKSLIKVLYSW